MGSILAFELAEDVVAARDIREVAGGVEFKGTLETAYRACLWSRVASRVLMPLRTFSAPTVEKLYGGVKAIRWSDHLTAANTLAVDFSSTRSAITHTHYGALKVKDAIVDQFRSTQGARPSIKVDQPDVRVNVYLNDNQATVSLDLSGESLHRRGYREDGAYAPLKENLAAAILSHADWPRIASHGGALLDPMCGSGTLLLEGAWIATRTAPGLMRPYFGFLGWRGHAPEVWAGVVNEARKLSQLDPARRPASAFSPIVGYDEDAHAVKVALSNRERAGLRNRVHFEKRSLAACQPVAGRVPDGASLGLVVVNPPYGERIGEVDELRGLYRQIGDVFKQRFKGWDGYVFTGSPELAKCIGLRASRRIVLWNGPIECRLLKFELY